jgi:hypothetical protein
LGLVGELFRDDLLDKGEWWVPDLARQLSVIPRKIHDWAKQGWIQARQVPSGGNHLSCGLIKRMSVDPGGWPSTRVPGSQPDTPIW